MNEVFLVHVFMYESCRVDFVWTELSYVFYFVFLSPETRQYVY